MERKSKVPHLLLIAFLIFVGWVVYDGLMLASGDPGATARHRAMEAEAAERRVQAIIDAERQEQARQARALRDAAEAIRREPELFGVRR